MVRILIARMLIHRLPNQCELYVCTIHFYCAAEPTDKIDVKKFIYNVVFLPNNLSK